MIPTPKALSPSTWCGMRPIEATIWMVGMRMMSPLVAPARLLLALAFAVNGCQDESGAMLSPDAGELDPVATSQMDTTLAGADDDGNGVRDDVDQYIATLEADPDKRVAVTAVARERTAMMLLGGA